eukprot:11164246-Lingulodinium_polyedra.AAC.1
MARATKTGPRAPLWLFGALEAHWGFAKTALCPGVAAHGPAAAAALAGRTCGPGPARQRAYE